VLPELLRAFPLLTDTARLYLRRSVTCIAELRVCSEMPGVFLRFAASNTRVALGAASHVCHSMRQVCPLWETSAVLLHFADGALIRLVCRAAL